MTLVQCLHSSSWFLRRCAVAEIQPRVARVRSQPGEDPTQVLYARLEGQVVSDDEWIEVVW